MESYAKYIFDNEKEGCKEYSGYIALTVDNINCDLMFSMKKSSRWFHLTDSEIFIDSTIENYYLYFHKSFHNDDDFNNEKEITVEIITKFLQKIYEILDTLVFDKITGQLVERNVLELHNAKKQAFKKFIKINDDCSVCLEPTQQKTPCNHILCMSCWQKIKKLKCPICRRDIQFLNENESDE